MSSFPTQKIADLTKAEKWDEFREEIKIWLQSQDEQESAGTELLDAVHAYAKISNHFMEKYLAELDNIQAASQVIKNVRQSLADADRSKEIKKKIKDF